MMIISYSKSEFNNNILKNNMDASIDSYRNYKKYFKYPFGIKGIKNNFKDYNF